jgi:hypothetical protein
LLECKEFIDKLTEFKSHKEKANVADSIEFDKSSEEVYAEDKGHDFFLTQKAENSSVSGSNIDESEGLSYEKRIGFDKRKLIDLFQEIEEKNLFLINNVQDEEQILEYIKKSKASVIEKKQKEIDSNNTVNFRREEEHPDNQLNYPQTHSKVGDR